MTVLLTSAVEGEGLADWCAIFLSFLFNYKSKLNKTKILHLVIYWHRNSQKWNGSRRIPPKKILRDCQFNEKKWCGMKSRYPMIANMFWNILVIIWLNMNKTKSDNIKKFITWDIKLPKVNALMVSISNLITKSKIIVNIGKNIIL